MTQDEITAFRAEFASIVYWKGQVKAQASRIKQLDAWNKGGSHDKAILLAVDKLTEYKDKLKEKLIGKTYDEWREFSKKLSALNSKLKNARNDSTKAKWQWEIHNINFNQQKATI